MKLHWLLLLLGCLPNWLYASEPHQRLDTFLQSLQTVYAQFNQKLYNENGMLLEESSGNMYVQRPNQFRWEYQQPYNQLIVADGKQVWIYDSDLEQVIVKPLDAALGKTPAFLLSRNRKIEEDFFVNKLPSEAQVTRFELIPKDDQAQFDSMRVNLQGETILGFELMDNLGQTTHINFSQVRQNLKFRKSLFRFTPPAGVDILKEN